jgi:hypothetical protein
VPALQMCSHAVGVPCRSLDSFFSRINFFFFKLFIRF